MERKVSIQIQNKKTKTDNRLKKHINYRRRKFILEKYLGKIKYFPKFILEEGQE